MRDIFSDVKYKLSPLCLSKGLALPVGPCSPGYYCTGGATQARPADGEAGSICPPGAYCGKAVNKIPNKVLKLDINCVMEP